MLLSVSLGKFLKIVKIKVFLKLILNMHITSPGPVAHLVGVVSHATKRCGFDSQSGHILRLWVWSLIGASTRSNQSMFLDHINVSLSLSLPQMNKNKSLGEDKKKLSIHIMKIRMQVQQNVNQLLLGDTDTKVCGSVIWAFELWKLPSHGFLRKKWGLIWPLLIHFCPSGLGPVVDHTPDWTKPQSACFLAAQHKHICILKINSLPALKSH